MAPLSAGRRSPHLPSRTVGRLRTLLVGVALLDVVVLALATVLASEARIAFDVWGSGPSAGLISAATPSILLAWVAMLATQGACGPGPVRVPALGGHPRRAAAVPGAGAR